MRLSLVLLASTSLAACSGGGPTTVGGNAAPGGGTGVVPSSGHTFVNPTEEKTYATIGGVQHYEYYTDDRNIRQQYGQLYAGDATTARNSGTTIAYNPRDAIFFITMNQNTASVNNTLRFQDPVHRTDFGGASEPQDGVPNIPSRNIQYLQAGGSTGNPVYDLTQSRTFPIGPDGATRNVSTFFYQKPGTTTNYVTYAGFARNATMVTTQSVPESTATWLRQEHILERGAFVYGERTANSAVPTLGTGTYTGEMIASMVFNPLLDTVAGTPTYFQWMTGNATTKVDFAANTFTIDMTGSVMAPQFDIFTNRVFTLQEGATFAAAGSGRIDLINAGGFLGAINSAYFVQPGPGGARLDVSIAGSSVDGAFYGPAAQEVGGGFRIVGGNPDERIDIIGAFTAKK